MIKRFIPDYMIYLISYVFELINWKCNTASQFRILMLTLWFVSAFLKFVSFLLWKHEKILKFSAIYIWGSCLALKTDRNLYYNIYCSTAYNYLFHVNTIFTSYSKSDRCIYELTLEHLKLRGPYVETLCVFFCMEIIINAEMLAWKNYYN